MQIRPYPEDDGRRVWLSATEQQRLREQFDEHPNRELAVRLGLAGLRASEIVDICRADLRELDGDASVVKLRVVDAKRGDREVPISADLASDLRTVANVLGVAATEPVVDCAEKTVTRWVRNAATTLAATDDEPDGWRHVRPHDLRRTWATTTYYSLALGGVPIAEELTMGWGGWAQTASGRQTFRENYLGPAPDRVVEAVADHLPVG